MILVGNQRGGAQNLALHLLKDENEHVEVHELRGFASNTLIAALNEVHAISRGTKCKQFLYSLSLNPPLEKDVKISDFEAAIERIEEKLGLTNQPRAIVFHTKEGPKGVRRHAHAVWSRIDTGAMKAVQMSFDHRKLKQLSRELFIEHGWKMPRGLANSQERDPKNFTLAEWQQAKRIGTDPRAIKTAIQDAWAISDNKASFAQAMAERGYEVARGDRRGFVAVDVHGEVYSIPRQANVKTKQVRERLGAEAALPSVDEAKAKIAARILPKLDDFQKWLVAQNQQRRRQFERMRKNLVARQRAERQVLKERIEARRIAETIMRQDRFRTGLGGIWDRLRGQHKQIIQRNEREALAAFERDRDETDQLIFRQLEKRHQLSRAMRKEHSKTKELQQGLSRERQAYQQMRVPSALEESRKVFLHDRKTTQTTPRHRGPSRE
ncbi:MAG: hypothetical protein DHS20C05_13320 [Hyphococcus sp.]|nr:MAG: hypothetical protein DHS20C05_13320 [Marinicaulis sp.]